MNFVEYIVIFSIAIEVFDNHLIADQRSHSQTRWSWAEVHNYCWHFFRLFSFSFVTFELMSRCIIFECLLHNHLFANEVYCRNQSSSWYLSQLLVALARASSLLILWELSVSLSSNVVVFSRAHLSRLSLSWKKRMILSDRLALFFDLMISFQQACKSFNSSSETKSKIDILRTHSVSDDSFDLTIIDQVTAFANAQILTRRFSVVVAFSRFLITRHRSFVALAHFYSFVVRLRFSVAQSASSSLSLIIDRAIFDRLLREWEKKKKMMKKKMKRLRKKNAMLTKKTRDLKKRIEKLKEKIENLKKEMKKMKKNKKREKKFDLIAFDMYEKLREKNMTLKMKMNELKKRLEKAVKLSNEWRE